MSGRKSRIRLHLIAVLSGGSTAAQSTSATVTGVVLDEHRAVLSDTAVPLTNVETGAVRRTTSDRAGQFRIAGVIPGGYELRLEHYHRDDAWDATVGSAKLAVPQVDKARIDQKIIGGAAGGPLVRNRTFFLGSIEHLIRDTDHVVTSSVLRVFRPDDPATLPQRTRNPNLLGVSIPPSRRTRC